MIQAGSMTTEMISIICLKISYSAILIALAYAIIWSAYYFIRDTIARFKSPKFTLSLDSYQPRFAYLNNQIFECAYCGASFTTAYNCTVHEWCHTLRPRIAAHPQTAYERTLQNPLDEIHWTTKDYIYDALRNGTTPQEITMLYGISPLIVRLVAEGMSGRRAMIETTVSRNLINKDVVKEQMEKIRILSTMIQHGMISNETFKDMMGWVDDLDARRNQIYLYIAEGDVDSIMIQLEKEDNKSLINIMQDWLIDNVEVSDA